MVDKFESHHSDEDIDTNPEGLQDESGETGQLEDLMNKEANADNLEKERWSSLSDVVRLITPYETYCSTEFVTEAEGLGLSTMQYAKLIYLMYVTDQPELIDSVTPIDDDGLLFDDLNLSDSAVITEIPSKVQVKDIMNISNCFALEKIPDDFKCGGAIIAHGVSWETKEKLLDLVKAGLVKGPILWKRPPMSG
jgi:hypothetical protein